MYEYIPEEIKILKNTDNRLSPTPSPTVPTISARYP